MTWNTSFQPLLACKVSFEKSADSVMGTPLQVTVSFSVSILITSVLNSASYRLPISPLLTCIFSGALKCSVIWAIFFFLAHLLLKGAEP